MKKSIVFYGLVGIFFVILLFSPDYNFSLLNTGIYFTQGNVTIKDIKDAATKSEVLFAEEGLYGSVLVDKKEDTVVNINYEGADYELKVNTDSFFGNLKTLKINGKIQCGNGRIDSVTTSLAGGLPTILGKKGTALDIGLGCGLTLGMLERGDFEDIDSIEIDPVVVEASKEFNDIQGNALEDPRANIIVDDARNYLIRTDKKYDVIVNEPSHPYSTSCSNLLTKEFFLLMKERLKEDGIVIQWAPVGQLKSCDKPGFAILYKTFSSVFPYNYAFISKTQIPMIQPYFTNSDGEIKAEYDEVYDYPDPRWKYGEVTLVGSLKPIDIEGYINNFKESENDVVKHFREVKITDLRDHYLFSNEDVIGFADEVEFNTDDKPVIEFLVAKNLYSSKQDQCDIKEGIEFRGE